jgi:serine/threonine-protein kinase
VETGSRLVGRYLVHRRIAAGGMATVHLGRLLGAAGFSRTVAIKRLHDGYARDPEFVAMLLDEARLASQIRHPNVVPTLDVVAEQDELLVVMEYIEGDSLAHLAKLAGEKGERLPIALAATIVAQALHGLHAAHDATDRSGEPLGIVHRDVSPQNVLVGVDGIGRVLDFGIAKAASRATSTEDGQIKGKTAYMAPEQLQNTSVDRRTDVWAAAVMFWELLAGKRLFMSETPAATIGKVLHEPIDSPSRWVPEVPLELAMICMRGLSRDPEARFASAEEMALAIEDAVQPMRAKEIGAWVRETAASTLEARAEMVREVEQEEAPPPSHSTTDPVLRAALEEAERRRNMGDLPTDMGTPRSSARGRMPPIPSTPRTGPVYPPHLSPEVTDLATVRSSANYVIVPEAKTSRLSIVIAMMGGVALAAAIAVVFVFTRGKLTTAKEEPAPPPAVEPSASPPPPKPVESVAIELPATSASVTATAKKPGGKPYHPPPPAPKKPDCTVPYTIDANGNRHIRPECV